MKLKIEIKMDNAAFENDAGAEVARILRDFANTVSGSQMANEFTIGLRDINGNKVGEAKNRKR